jgi:hypothetical protein
MYGRDANEACWRYIHVLKGLLLWVQNGMCDRNIFSPDSSIGVFTIGVGFTHPGTNRKVGTLIRASQGPVARLPRVHTIKAPAE